MTRDSRKQAPRRVTHDGNVEGADLKNNSQSTTHIDPKAGTGGKLRMLAYLEKKCICYWPKPAHMIKSLTGGLEKSGTCLQCV